MEILNFILYADAIFKKKKKQNHVAVFWDSLENHAYPIWEL